MKDYIFLECPSCGYRKDIKDFRLDCKVCGYPSALFHIEYENLPQNFPLKENPHPILRYIPLLPLDFEEIVDPTVGGTPLFHSRSLGNLLGLKNLYIKDETRNPSGSFKDRGAIVGVSAAKALGYNFVGVASSGNFASAVARACTLSGLKCLVLLPEDTPEEKMVMIAAYGGKVVKVKGIFDDCRRLSIELSKKKDVISASWDLKPFTLEGWKTTLLEIFEQMNYTLPDTIIVPTGGGGHVLGTWKAAKELLKMKRVQHIPRIIGVQASGSAPYVKAVKENLNYVPKIENPQTIAKSLKVSSPSEKNEVLKAVREVGGTFIDVTDQEILEAVTMLSKMEGVFPEPGAAASVAGLKKLVEKGIISSSEKVVAVVTGSGLKDITDVKNVFGSFTSVEKDLPAEELFALAQSFYKL